MGTTYAIQADCPQALPGDRIDAELARIDGLMSTYDPDSELSRFNRAPTGEPMLVSREVVDVVDAAFGVAERTVGAFDATVAPLVALWGFGAEAAPRDPGPEQVAAASRSVGYQRIAHRQDPPTLEKRAPATLDLSGIAKGYAVDRLADVLDEAGCRAYLIEFGGEVRAFGNARGGGPWRVGVESPSGAGLVADVELRSGALATSGDYRQYRELDGVRVSHIIDPRTGFPVGHRLASATVVADTAMMADAYATALLVMGDVDGPAFADANGLAAIFIVRAEGGFEVFHSRAMRQYLNPGNRATTEKDSGRREGAGAELGGGRSVSRTLVRSSAR
ncbi:MAG: FAD:protein FMN transferase [Gammaproteobacteria bacterium]|nr:FAD:protein FMN transferase [Gammaproteobacteria bacterium]